MVMAHQLCNRITKKDHAAICLPKICDEYNQTCSLLLYRVTDKIVCNLLPKARMYLIHLNMRECEHLKRPAFISISECRNIQDLNLSGCLGLDVRYTINHE